MADSRLLVLVVNSSIFVLSGQKTCGGSMLSTFLHQGFFLVGSLIGHGDVTDHWRTETQVLMVGLSLGGSWVDVFTEFFGRTRCSEYWPTNPLSAGLNKSSAEVICDHWWCVYGSCLQHRSIKALVCISLTLCWWEKTHKIQTGAACSYIQYVKTPLDYENKILIFKNLKFISHLWPRWVYVNFWPALYVHTGLLFVKSKCFRRAKVVSVDLRVEKDQRWAGGFKCGSSSWRQVQMDQSSSDQDSWLCKLFLTRRENPDTKERRYGFHFIPTVVAETVDQSSDMMNGGVLCPFVQSCLTPSICTHFKNSALWFCKIPRR